MAEEFGSLALDFLTRITNVHWGGLPAEFEPNGHVLWRGSPLNMSKGTISMWFRVPKETIESVTWVQDLVFAPLQNLIPILAFSGQHAGPWTEFTFPVINTFYQATTPLPPYEYMAIPYHGAIPGPTWEMPYHPCLIAVYINENKKASLAVVLQTRDIGVPANTQQGAVAAAGEVDPDSGLLFGPTSVSYEDASHADAKMEWFDHNYQNGPEVVPDAWHHVLLSWDLQGSNSSFGRVFTDTDPNEKPFHEYFSARSLMYCAFDDTNLTRDALPSTQWIDGFGDNEIVCHGCSRLGGTPYDADPPDPDIAPPVPGLPTYTVAFAEGIQADAVAVPGEPIYEQWTGNVESQETEPVQAIKKIEVAELQVFPGLLLDTSIDQNRRAFIAYKEPGDEPVPSGTMEPVNPVKTEEKLGRRPDILIHTTGNWLIGKNTGKIGLQRVEVGGGEGDQIIQAGQFKPTKPIESYSPDPTLQK